jgi:hypothetical protein
LHGTLVVEPGISPEIDLKALSKRGQAVHTLRPVEKRRCTGNQDVQSGESARVHFIDQLPKGI